MVNAPQINVPAVEAKSLLGGDIKNLDDLWYFIGQEPANGLAVLAWLKGLQTEQIVTAMAAQGVRESQLKEVSNLKRFRLRLNQYWLEVGLCVGLLFLIMLGFRAFGYLDFLPSPVGLPDRIVVAARDLVPGQVLRSNDLYTARLQRHVDYFVTPTVYPEGLILSQRAPVSQFRPIKFEDVLRLQVVAKRDIIKSAKFVPEDLMVTWSPYQPDALTNPQQVLNLFSRYDIPGGAVVSCKFLYSDTRTDDPCPSLR